MRLISQKSLKLFTVVPLLNPVPGILNSACEGSCAVSVPCVMEEEVEKRRESPWASTVTAGVLCVPSDTEASKEKIAEYLIPL